MTGPARFMLARTARTAGVTLTLMLASCGSDNGAQSSGGSAGVTGGDFHSLVADPLTPGRLYVGGHTGVARSDDGGMSWGTVTSLNDADAMGWAVQANAIWVSGHPGLNVSFDDGATFSRRNAGLPDTDVHAFGSNDNTFLAAGPGIGVASSDDSGRSWMVISSSAGQGFFGRILADPDDPARLVAADVQSGVMISADGGRTWTPLGTEPVAWVSSGDGLRTIYASGGAAPQRSRDGGTTWEAVDVPVGATLLEMGSDGTLYAGVHDGNAVAVWFSGDDGVTWSRP